MPEREKLVEKLSASLADSYVLMLKTHNYHWNVTGPQFQSLHALFETQYTDLFAAVDEIAERIRALGQKAPGSYAAFNKITHIKEASDEKISSNDMVSELLHDQEVIIATLKDALDAASAIEDPVSEDLLIERTNVHEKNAWMLRSSL